MRVQGNACDDVLPYRLRRVGFPVPCQSRFVRPGACRALRPIKKPPRMKALVLAGWFACRG